LFFLFSLKANTIIGGQKRENIGHCKKLNFKSTIEANIIKLFTFNLVFMLNTLDRLSLKKFIAWSCEVNLIKLFVINLLTLFVSKTILLMQPLFFCPVKKYNFQKSQKGFLRFTLEACIIKLMTSVIYGFRKKLECLSLASLSSLV